MHSGLKSWKNLLDFAFHYFSIPLLLKTLFYPWQMDSVAHDKKFVFIEKLAFAIFIRLMGFVARSILIIFGLLFTFIIFVSFPLFFFVPISISRESLMEEGSVGFALSFGNTFFLNKHGRDAHLPIGLRVYGKEKAIRMLERGLSKETKRNVLLIGDAGVGKKTMVNYLGLLGTSGISFPAIRYHRIVELNTETLSMEDLDRCLKEGAHSGNVILVIKDIHLYQGAYELLLPYLENKHLGFICTTDFGGYDGVLKNHPEFLSYFEKVDLLSPEAEDLLKILKNHRSLKRIKIKDDLLLELMKLSVKYIGNQSEPLRSISVLEELETLKREITLEDIKSVISDKTNIPLGSLGQDEREILIHLEEIMKNKIVGQDEAVHEVAEALKRLRAGLTSEDKPGGSFLFLGPTGVGKTYTAKVLAENYFGHKNAMVRFDMSEYAMPSSMPLFLEKLGATIEEMPFCLLFFDELEKANRDIHNLFLQILDEGSITRPNGRQASFKEALIIATTNAGSREIIKDTDISKKYLIEVLIRDGIFSPEFLNRWGSVIVFKPLKMSQIKNVARLLLYEFAEKVFEEKNIKLVITDELVEKVAEAGFDADFGARPIERAIEEIVENKIADYIIAGGGVGEIKIL